MLGQEDVILQRTFTTSVVCMSPSGSMYYIEKNDFFEKLKKNQTVWNQIMQASQVKNQATITKIKRAVNDNQQMTDYFNLTKIKHGWEEKHHVNLQMGKLDDWRATFKQIVQH